MNALLVKCLDTRTGDAGLVAEIDLWRHALGTGVAVTGGYRGLRTADVYVLFALAPTSDASSPDVGALRAALQSRIAESKLSATVDRLGCVLDVPGASVGAPSPIQYVVETDALEGWDDELDRWYDTEHLAGLAHVPGCVRARRFRNLDAGPRSCAWYDLVAPEVLESPAWLAVRRTPWSERVRPQFRNTRRTLFRAVAMR